MIGSRIQTEFDTLTQGRHLRDQCWARRFQAALFVDLLLVDILLLSNTSCQKKDASVLFKCVEAFSRIFRCSKIPLGSADSSTKSNIHSSFCQLILSGNTALFTSSLVLLLSGKMLFESDEHTSNITCLFAFALFHFDYNSYSDFRLRLRRFRLSLRKQLFFLILYFLHFEFTEKKALK